ncbi:MAG TPA: ABC transporter substrate-binding protein [Pseudonocardiaceae bacterium]|nr:ABC transporter substrate-binding protein [Pseudonocardiaceae bacterium]
MQFKLIAKLTAAATLAVLAGCGGGDPLESGGTTATNGGGGEVVVGSADFTENVLLAEIYAAALRGAGANVTTKLRIGARETVVKGLQDSSLAVVPEYSGNLLAYLDKSATQTKPDEVYTALQSAVPDGLEVLDMSEAEDSDVLVVTEQTATQNNLSTVEDLAPRCGEFVLGAAGEWKQRWEAKIKEIYGCTFKSIQTTDAGGPVTVEALKSGKVQVVNLFTTASAIDSNGFKALEDTKRMYPAQNVLPLIRSDALNDAQKEALNKVSAALTTERLTALVARVEVDKENAADVAADFLRDAGIQGQ